MRVPIEVFVAVWIFPIVLGSPLAIKNQNEDISDLASRPIRSNPSIYSEPRKMVIEPSDLRQRRRPPSDWGKNDKYKNRRTTTNKSEAIGVTEIYMPKSRYLSRGYKPVYIYYVEDSTEDESSTRQPSKEGFENGELSSSLKHETRSRSSSEVKTFEDGENSSIEKRKGSLLEEDRLNENAREKSANLGEQSNAESDNDDSEDDEYVDDSEYEDSEEYPDTDDSALSPPDQARQTGSNKVCVHHRSNQNQEVHGHYPKLGNPQQYTNQDYHMQYNPHYGGYPSNTGYEGYYPSTGNQGHYHDPRYQRRLSDPNYPKHITGHQGPPNVNNGPYPYKGYEDPHQGYKVPYPYRIYQGPHPVYQGPVPYHGHQSPLPYPGYQGPYPDHGGSPTDRGDHVNPVNIKEVDRNCDHTNTNLGRGGHEPEPVVGSGQDGTFSDAESDHSSSGDENPEYYDDSEYEDDEKESEDSNDRPEIPLQSDITFESKELPNVSDKIPGMDVIKEKTETIVESELNNDSLDLKSEAPNESNRGNETNNKSGRESEEVIHKCIKSIGNEEILNSTILDDCMSETIENAEGNKSGRLLDIFTRTNLTVECTTPKNESGQCKSFTECPIRNIMDNYNLFLQYMCLRGVFVGVCCPDNPVVEISDTDDDNTTKIPLDIQQPPEGCGLSQKTRIVGGTISAPHEWTWMVALMRRNRFFCGGVIINNWYVLTAAHCVLGVNVKDLKVRLGEYNFMERTENQHDINVAEIKRHAMFVTATFQHDIALLKLKRRIEYSKFIGSICLPETNARSYSDGKATVVGWGTVSFGGAASPILRQVTVPVWDNEDCDRTYFLERIDDSFLCAGSTENGEDACQGDSGGPLMTLNSDNRWEVIGIVSWGRRCGDPTYPGVYTRVTSYLDWISAHSQ